MNPEKAPSPSFEAVLADVKAIEDRIRSRLGTVPLEGSASESELRYLFNLVQENNSKTVAEIGFNAGFSALAFLHARPDVTLTSFDLGDHEYVHVAKEYIDEKFPGRHTLILGDSQETVPAHKMNEGDELRPVFDTIFIDGGHDYETAYADIKNMNTFAHPTTDVIMDDLVKCPTKPWGRGPRKAWTQAIDEGMVQQYELFEDGKLVEEVGWCSASRGWARGRYVL